MAGPPVPLLVEAGCDRTLRLATQSADIVSFSRSMSAGSTAQEIAIDASLEWMSGLHRHDFVNNRTEPANRHQALTAG
ncbi:hypothetical protein ABZ547_29100 [Streptomyces sparsogenes]|uniref:hypothetical protein n=1 Tax=Streptomyces sparsogenes TaxID=67365 RepID=UPI0033F6965D